jgi:hypothetical protein
MNFKLNFEISQPDFKIKHGEGILFLGSCFSDEIAAKAAYNGLKVTSNPFGTVFHPSLLGSFITDSINGIKEERLLKREDIHLSWDANSSVYDFSSEKLILKLSELRANFVLELKQAKVIFITFGTAWVYKLLESQKLVANCHKIPSNQFSKELSSIEDLTSEWENVIDILFSINPNLKIIFTISPVRHSKDGLIENNWSKSVLIETVRRIQLSKKCYYFPSYEIVIDELRDYRFYKEDRVHPTEEAIQYIWERLEQTYFKESSIELNSKVSELRRGLMHRSLHENSLENLNRIKRLEEKLSTFLNLHREIIW